MGMRSLMRRGRPPAQRPPRPAPARPRPASRQLPRRLRTRSQPMAGQAGGLGLSRPGLRPWLVLPGPGWGGLGGHRFSGQQRDAAGAQGERRLPGAAQAAGHRTGTPAGPGRGGGSWAARTEQAPLLPSPPRPSPAQDRCPGPAAPREAARSLGAWGRDGDKVTHGAQEPGPRREKRLSPGGSRGGRGGAGRGQEHFQTHTASVPPK